MTAQAGAAMTHLSAGKRVGLVALAVLNTAP
jgi:hypothetical protein